MSFKKRIEKDRHGDNSMMQRSYDKRMINKEEDSNSQKGDAERFKQ